MNSQLLSLLERVDAKLDRVDERLNKLDVRMAKYNSELEFHVARTTQLEDELLPIIKHVEQVRGAIKLIAAIGSLLVVIGAVGYLFK